MDRQRVNTISKDTKKSKDEHLKSVKIKTAVAISYEEQDTAPKIIASGRGYVAEKMIQTAKESNVSVHQDAKLADTLSKLEIGQNIPSELYGVVAEVLLFVDNLDQIKSKVLPEKYKSKK